jgi:hypothetical protein
MPESIWYYEDYVVAQNREYLIYKKEILSKNTALRSTMMQSGGSEKWKWKKTSTTKTSTHPSLWESDSPISVALLLYCHYFSS